MKRGRGRPPLPPGEGKTAAFTTRLRPRLKGSLEVAAANAGRSLSEEIERRLERSFDEEEAFEQYLGGAEMLGLFKAMAGVAAAIEARIGTAWLEDQMAFTTVVAAWAALLNQHSPEKSQSVPTQELADSITTIL